MLASAGVVGATSIGAVAFTQGSVSRDVSVDIVADDAGPITLVAGATDAVTLTNGLLTIDTDTGRAAGLNGDGSFTYGDPTDGSLAFGFKMTNNGGGARDFTFGIEGFSPAGAFGMEIWNDAGTSQGSVTQSTDLTVAAVASGASLYAVLTIDTSGLDSTDTLSGQFTISGVP